jgi:hypothetical protein
MYFRYRTGNSNDYTSAPEGYHSIKGVGRNIPDENGQTEFDKDIIVPSGKTIANPHLKIQYSQLNFNEYIVFDPDRILIKFIVQFDRSNSDQSNSDQSKSDQSNSDQYKSDQSNSDQYKSDQSNSDQYKSDQSNSDQYKSDQSNSDQSNSMCEIF